MTAPKRPPGRPRKSPQQEPQFSRPKRLEGDRVLLKAYVTPAEAGKFKSTAKSQKTTVSGLIREFIASLPEPQEPE